MSYATTADVQALNRARTIGSGNGQPTTSDVQTLLDLTASEIDAILIVKGYSVPVSESNTTAYGLLRTINALGAVAKMERSAPTSPNLDRFEREWEEAKTFLKDSQFAMDAAKDQQRASPRGPGVSTANGVTPGQTVDPNYPTMGVDTVPIRLQNTGGVPFFSRTMQF